MTLPALLVIGAGGHARACVDVIEEMRTFSIGGLIGSPAEVGTRVLDHPVIGTDADLPALVATYSHAFIAVGQIKTSAPRERIFRQLRELGYLLPTIVSPRAHVSRHASVGDGTIIMHAAIVNAGAVIGRNCIVNNQALIEHDVVVEDHCHVSTAAVVNGGVQIGTGTFVGSQSCVRQGIRVGERCVIGMGQQVLKDCANDARFPARKVVA